MRPARVLMAPFEVAGVVGALRDGLRARGVAAELWALTPHPFVRTHDRLVPGYAARALAGLIAPLRHDVLHFHFGTTLAEFVDAAWGRVAGRPLTLMHYWGDDCRLRTESGLRPLDAGPDWEREQRTRERTIRRRLRIAGRLCAAALVSDLELAQFVAPWFRAVYLVPTPLRLPLVPDAAPPPLPGEGPIVFHAPSDQLVKGTATILAAIEAVAARRPLRLRTVTGVPRAEVLAELARADIVVDQLGARTSGVFALEAMALGKPVLTALDRDLLAPFARTSPLVPVTAQTLERELERLVDDAERRSALGAAGRRFVQEVHDADRVAEAILHVYAHAARRPRGPFEATAAGVRPLVWPAE